MTTSQPADSSTSTAAIAVSGWKWLLKVSGHSTTRIADCGLRTADLFLDRNHLTKVCVAKRGIERRVETPPNIFNAVETIGNRAATLTSRGTLAQSGAQR